MFVVFFDGSKDFLSPTPEGTKSRSGSSSLSSSPRSLAGSRGGSFRSRASSALPAIEEEPILSNSPQVVRLLHQPDTTPEEGTEREKEATVVFLLIIAETLKALGL